MIGALVVARREVVMRPRSGSFLTPTSLFRIEVGGCFGPGWGDSAHCFLTLVMASRL